VLAEYGSLEKIPASSAEWTVSVRGAPKLAATLRERWKDAMLFRHLATLRTDVPPITVDELEYRGPRPEFEALAASWGRPELWSRAKALC
jgi:5'-3' exonuclease